HDVDELWTGRDREPLVGSDGDTGSLVGREQGGNGGSGLGGAEGGEEESYEAADVAAEVARGLDHERGQPGKDDLLDDLVARRPAAVDGRRMHARPLGDGLDGGRCEPLLGEQLAGGEEDALVDAGGAR